MEITDIVPSDFIETDENLIIVYDFNDNEFEKNYLIFGEKYTLYKSFIVSEVDTNIHKKSYFLIKLIHYKAKEYYEIFNSNKLLNNKDIMDKLYKNKNFNINFINNRYYMVQFYNDIIYYLSNKFDNFIRRFLTIKSADFVFDNIYKNKRIKKIKIEENSLDFYKYCYDNAYNNICLYHYFKNVSKLTVSNTLDKFYICMVNYV